MADNTNYHINYCFRRFRKPPDPQMMKRMSTIQCFYSRMLKLSNSLSLCSAPIIHAKEITASHQIESHTPEYLKLSVVTDADVQNYLAAETGYMRLQQMFSKDHKGNISDELQLVKSSTESGTIFGGILMSIFGARETREKYQQQTKAVAFRTPVQATRYINDQTWLGAMKFGAKWGLRIGAFTICFVGISQTIAVYRNKTSPLEYTVSTAVAGAVMKANLGIKGMIGGGFLGGIFGFLAGLCLYGTMVLENQTQEQRNYERIVKKLEMARNPANEIESIKRSHENSFVTG